MRTTTSLLLFAASVALAASLGGTAVAAPVPKHLMKPIENTESDRLQWKWKLESLTIGNMALTGKEFEMVLEFRGGAMTAHGQGTVTTATVKLDAADGMKRITTTTIRVANTQGMPLRNESDEAFGYTLDDDKLVLAMTVGADAPKGIAADPTKKPADDVVVLVLTRVKDKN